MLNKVHNSTKYVNIPDDCLDTRIPLFSDDAFRQGIIYEAKYIGSMDVARPQNRLEIVSAMRRIRFEFKAKAVKKERIFFKISTDGVFVNLRTKKKTPIKLRLSQSFNLLHTSTPSPHSSSLDHQQASSSSASSSCTPGLLLMHHPIYRIFYVSHDSQDLKIFSYIARDSKSTNFKCNVFKALRKMEAMKIVRTVGQAFDVCHRLSQKNNSNPEDSKSVSDLNENDKEPDKPIENGEKEEEANQKEDAIKSANQKPILPISQSAQPIRSADLIKITDTDDDDVDNEEEEDDDDDDESGGNGRGGGESLSTLDDLFGSNWWKKDRKKNKSVPNSMSEPSIKSHIKPPNGLFNSSLFNSALDGSPCLPENDDESLINIAKKLNAFDNSNFLSSYLFLNYLISKQLSEQLPQSSHSSHNLLSNHNNTTTASASATPNINSSPYSTQIPISPSFSGAFTSNANSLLGNSQKRKQLLQNSAQLFPDSNNNSNHTDDDNLMSLPTKLDTTQLHLLKSQLEDEIRFRLMCQSQINQLSSKNRQLSTFIRRTFEEIRHNKCDSCMMRLSSMDVSNGVGTNHKEDNFNKKNNNSSSTNEDVEASLLTSNLNGRQSSFSVKQASLYQSSHFDSVNSSQQLSQISMSSKLQSSSATVSKSQSTSVFNTQTKALTQSITSSSSIISSNKNEPHNNSKKSNHSSKLNSIETDPFGVPLKEKDPFNCDAYEVTEKEVKFDDVNFYRQNDSVNKSVQRNFYKMTSWDKGEEHASVTTTINNHYDNDEQINEATDLFGSSVFPTNNSSINDNDSSTEKMTNKSDVSDPFVIPTYLYNPAITNSNSTTSAGSNSTITTGSLKN